MNCFRNIFFNIHPGTSPEQLQLKYPQSHIEYNAVEEEQGGEGDHDAPAEVGFSDGAGVVDIFVEL